jgi:sugar phosphate isomerase/epimerase
MEIGISSASFYPELNTEDTIKLMAETGFSSGEIFLNTPSEYEEDFIKMLIEEKEKYSFNVNSIHSCSSQYEPFLFDKYKRRRDDMLVYYKKLCKAAKMLGAKCYTFHGMRFGSINQEDMGFIVEVYNELAYISMEEGIKLAQENVSWCMSSSLKFLETLKEKCKYPVYFTFDIKQAYKADIDPIKYIDVMGEKIVNYHINDRDEKHLCLLPGHGNVDYKAIHAKLKEAGYEGIATLEVYRENYSGYNELRETKKFLENLF